MTSYELKGMVERLEGVGVEYRYIYSMFRCVSSKSQSIDVNDIPFIWGEGWKRDLIIYLFFKSPLYLSSNEKARRIPLNIIIFRYLRIREILLLLQKKSCYLRRRVYFLSSSSLLSLRQ
jgi:hypothetical protein